MNRDYRTPGPNLPRRLLYLTEGLAMTAVLDLLFYRSVWAFFPLLLLVPFYLRGRIRLYRDAQRKKVETEFAEALRTMSSSFLAGRAEAAVFSDTEEALRATFGSSSLLAEEFSAINRGIRLQSAPDRLLWSFAERSGSEEIRGFASVYTAAARTGGDLPRILAECAVRMRLRMEAGREIETATASRRLEFHVMCVMPFAVILFLSLSSPELMDRLYGTLPGAVCMTVCLLICLLAIRLGRSITAIEV